MIWRTPGLPRFLGVTTPPRCYFAYNRNKGYVGHESNFWFGPLSETHILQPRCHFEKPKFKLFSPKMLFVKTAIPWQNSRGRHNRHVHNLSAPPLNKEMGINELQNCHRIEVFNTDFLFSSREVSLRCGSCSCRLLKKAFCQTETTAEIKLRWHLQPEAISFLLMCQT